MGDMLQGPKKERVENQFLESKIGFCIEKIDSKFGFC